MPIKIVKPEVNEEKLAYLGIIKFWKYQVYSELWFRMHWCARFPNTHFEIYKWIDLVNKVIVALLE